MKTKKDSGKEKDFPKKEEVPLKERKINSKRLLFGIIALVFLLLISGIVWNSFQREKKQSEERAAFVADSLRRDSIQKVQIATKKKIKSLPSKPEEAFIKFVQAHPKYTPEKYGLSLISTWGDFSFNYDGKKYSVKSSKRVYAMNQIDLEESKEENYRSSAKIYMDNAGQILHPKNFDIEARYYVHKFPEELNFEEACKIDLIFPLSLRARYQYMESGYLVIDYEDLSTRHQEAEKLEVIHPPKWIVYYSNGNGNKSFFLVSQDKNLWRTHEEAEKFRQNPKTSEELEGIQEKTMKKQSSKKPTSKKVLKK